MVEAQQNRRHGPQGRKPKQVSLGACIANKVQGRQREQDHWAHEVAKRAQRYESALYEQLHAQKQAQTQGQVQDQDQVQVQGQDQGQTQAQKQAQAQDKVRTCARATAEAQDALFEALEGYRMAQDGSSPEPRLWLPLPANYLPREGDVVGTAANHGRVEQVTEHFVRVYHSTKGRWSIRRRDLTRIDAACLDGGGVA